jgi:hypothetical protein
MRDEDAQRRAVRGEGGRGSCNNSDCRAAGRPRSARAGRQPAAAFIRATSGIDWGVNQGGWNVIVHNQSDNVWLKAISPLPTDMVKYSSGDIHPRADGFVNGRPSLIFNGPANMNFAYAARQAGPVCFD